jgi:hypothetical protein
MRKIGRYKRFLVGTLFFVFLALTILGSFSNKAMALGDFDNDGVSDSKENELASKCAPILNFAAGEQFFPTSIEYHLNNAVLKQKNLDTGETTIIDNSPTVDKISHYSTEDYYLDNKLGDLDEIAEDYKQVKDLIGYIVYTRVTKTSQNLIVQYWFFYAFNPGTINQHEGDWEMIEIILELASETPLYATYSQHFSGERASWNDVERFNVTHPIVYAALGSHANYYKSYQGKIGLESDILGNAFTLKPNDFNQYF